MIAVTLSNQDGARGRGNAKAFVLKINTRMDDQAIQMGSTDFHRVGSKDQRPSDATAEVHSYATKMSCLSRLFVGLLPIEVCR